MAKLHGFARPMDLITEFDGERRRCCSEAEAKICSPVDNGRWRDSYGGSSCRKQNERRLARFLRHNSHGFNHVKIVREVQVEWRKNPQIGSINCQICKDVVRFIWSHGCGDIFAEWRPDGYVWQFEETFPGASLQHEDAFVREFQHLPEPENLENWQCLGWL